MNNVNKSKVLKQLSIRTDALRRAMDVVVNGSTPDFGKWVSFKDYLRTYSALARAYIEVTGDNSVPTYNVEKLKEQMDTPWLLQKQIFETAHAATIMLSAVLNTYNDGVSASISEVQDLLVANLRKVIFQPPERETEVQNAVEALFIGRGFQRGVHYEREAGKFRFSGREFIP